MRTLIESWIQDAKYSARRLASRPTYLTLAVLTLALGVGGAAAILNIVRPLLLKPLPYDRPSQLGVLWHNGDWTEEEFLYLRPRFPGFRNMAAYRPLDATLEMPGEPIRLARGIATSSELFTVLGVRPVLGRAFQSGDDLDGADPTVILSYATWQRLGADPSLIGRSIPIGGAPRRVIGVMPRGFWFPDPSVEIWTAAPLSSERRSGNYTLVGRAMFPLNRMQPSVNALAASLKPRFHYPSDWDKTRDPAVRPLRDFVTGRVRPALLATLGGMLLLLFMASVNVASLMLGQVGGRGSELAVRTALGAGRRRLIQQLVIEALAIGALAGVTGAVVATLGFQTLVRSLPLGSLAGATRPEGFLLAAAMGVALVAAAGLALIPAFVLGRGDLRESMSSTRAGGLTVRGSGVESGLVIAQVALAVLLAAGTGLLLKSVAHLRGIDPGLAIERSAVIDATLPTQLSNPERQQAILQLLPSLQALPGAAAVAATQKLPLRGPGDSWGIRVEGGNPDVDGTTTYFRIVTRDYFEALGIRVLRGRGFEPGDKDGTELVTVINEALAKKYFPGQDPLGRIVHTGFGDQGERVIGVVRNVAEANLTDDEPPARYMLYDQVGSAYTPQRVTFVLAAQRPEALPALLQAARTTVTREGRRFAIESSATMSRVLDEAVGPPGQVATLLSILAGLSLILGAVGVYGMISQFTQRRAREYGIRMALGSSPGRVISSVLGRGAALVAAGSVAGIAAALYLTRLLRALLYGVGTNDPPTLAGAVLVLLLVGMIAALVPAWRASRTDPVAVLRDP